jgi:hypothetical protein
MMTNTYRRRRAGSWSKTGRHAAAFLYGGRSSGSVVQHATEKHADDMGAMCDGGRTKERIDTGLVAILTRALGNQDMAVLY